MGAMIQSKRRNKHAEGGERKGEMDWRKQKFGFPVSVGRDNGGANRPKTGRVPVGSWNTPNSYEEPTYSPFHELECGRSLQRSCMSWRVWCMHASCQTSRPWFNMEASCEGASPRLLQKPYDFEVDLYVNFLMNRMKTVLSSMK